MAITTTLSAELLTDVSAQARRYPTSDHGKIRVQYGKVTQGVAIGDAGSFLEFFDLPPGRVRLLLDSARVQSSVLGASRLLKIGHRLYYDKGVPSDDAGEPEDDDAFGVGIDVSAAAILNGRGTLLSLKFDIFSRGGVRVFGTITGGTIPAGATIEYLLPYVYE